MGRVRGSRRIAVLMALAMFTSACAGGSGDDANAESDVAVTTPSPSTTAATRPQIDRLGLNDLSSSAVGGNATTWYLTNGAGQLSGPTITLRMDEDGIAVRSECSLLLGTYAVFESYAEGVDVETELFIERKRRPERPGCDAFERRAMTVLFQALFHATGYRVDADEVRFFVNERDIIFSREPTLDRGGPGLDPFTWRVVHVGERQSWARERTGVATTEEQLRDLLFATVDGAAADVEIDFETHVALLLTDPRFSACADAPIDALVLDETRERIYSVPAVDLECETDAQREMAVILEVDRSVLPAGRFVLQLGPHEVLFGFPGERRVVLDDLSALGTEIEANDVGYAPIEDPAAPPCCDTKIIRGQFIEASRTFHQLDFLAANGRWWQASTPAIVANPLRQWFPTRSERADLIITYIGAEPIHLRVTANEHDEQYWPFESAAWWDDPTFEASVFAPVLAERVELMRPRHRDGHVPAEIVARLLRSLDFDVSDPALNEATTEAAYERLAMDQAQLWLDGRFPYDERFLSTDVTRLDGSISGAGLPQGWLITKQWADEAGLTTMDQINADPNLAAELDRDGDGFGEFFACPVEDPCAQTQALQADFAAWDNLAPLFDGYDELASEFLARVAKGQPVVAYVATPSRLFADARVGTDTMWLSVEEASVLSSGDSGQVASDGSIGFGDVDPETCLVGPDGCQLGWLPNEINAVANADWLRRNPKAEQLVRSAQFTAQDLSFFAAEMAAVGEGFTSEEVEVRVLAVADEWIAANNDRLEEWIDSARSAR